MGGAIFGIGTVTLTTQDCLFLNNRVVGGDATAGASVVVVVVTRRRSRTTATAVPLPSTRVQIHSKPHSFCDLQTVVYYGQGGAVGIHPHLHSNSLKPGSASIQTHSNPYSFCDLQTAVYYGQGGAIAINPGSASSAITMTNTNFTRNRVATYPINAIGVRAVIAVTVVVLSGSLCRACLYGSGSSGSGQHQPLEQQVGSPPTPPTPSG